MAENITVSGGSKEEKYKSLVPQIEALISGEENIIANLSNIMAALKYTMNFFWVGVYFVKNEELVLGPFQGPVACTRIKYGKGVCGTSWANKKSIIVPDVEQFPGHIACSSLSKSEIVIPVFNSKNKIVMVFDIDSDELNSFDTVDEQYLNKIISLINCDAIE